MSSVRLYKEVATVLDGVKQKKASLKTLIYASSYENSPQLFALANECAKYLEILQQVLGSLPKEFTQEEAISGDKSLAVVFLYEYLLGRKFGRNVGLRKMLLKYKQEIKSIVDPILSPCNARNLADVLKAKEKGSFQKIPRYMRVNLLKSSVSAVIEDLAEEGWESVGKLPVDRFRECALSLGKTQFGLDPHLDDVLVFPVDTNLHNHRLTVDGVLVQQDRASCIPAHVLGPSEGSVVLDCCAAPGNKTTHIASLMKDKGHVIALDRDQKRMTTLKAMIAKSGATCVQTAHQDFLSLDPSSEDASGIQMVLVDPSCSGSGMHQEEEDPSKDDALRARLATLKRFQIMILKHALRFPDVQKVVYSTCSVHIQENEEVVTEVMAHVSDYFTFEPVLPEWTGSRGRVGFPCSSDFLRLQRESDLTQGFFIACFKRTKEKNNIEADTSECKEESCSVGANHEESDALNTEVFENVHNSSAKKHDKEKDIDSSRNNVEGEDVLEDSKEQTDITSQRVSKERKKRKKDKENVSDSTDVKKPKLSCDKDLISNDDFTYKPTDGNSIEQLEDSKKHKQKHKKKKTKKDKDEQPNESYETTCHVDTERQRHKKEKDEEDSENNEDIINKKKKKKKSRSSNKESEDNEAIISKKKKKKKSKSSNEDSEDNDAIIDKKKKMKKSRSSNEDSENDEAIISKNKKKSKSTKIDNQVVHYSEDVEARLLNVEETMKRSKNHETAGDDDGAVEVRVKKKKKKSK